ncbi:hypothetical protein V3N99_12700 [Dermatophilaceae bacterium Soc4.6]
MTTWDEITSAVGLALGGEKVDGRRELLSCWGGTSEQDHAQRCVLAHYLADLEPQLDDEVTWDERAWAAYAHVGEDDLAAIGIASARALAPSLHLNLGDGYLRQGRTADAAAQLEAGLTAQSALLDDGYGALVRRGLVGLGKRIAGSKVEGGD